MDISLCWLLEKLNGWCNGEELTPALHARLTSILGRPGSGQRGTDTPITRCNCRPRFFFSRDHQKNRKKNLSTWRDEHGMESNGRRKSKRKEVEICSTNPTKYCISSALTVRKKCCVELHVFKYCWLVACHQYFFFWLVRHVCNSRLIYVISKFYIGKIIK